MYVPHRLLRFDMTLGHRLKSGLCCGLMRSFLRNRLSLGSMHSSTLLRSNFFWCSPLSGLTSTSSSDGKEDTCNKLVTAQITSCLPSCTYPTLPQQ
jgi:hypothetical protein